ncbi:XTP/dITP diphosphatase [Heyndrickxia sporothermodurans]
MKQVLIATKNKGKAKEFEKIFAKYQIEVKTLLDIPGSMDVDETGSTFEENAILKAETISKQLDIMTIADDSGLVIDALDGRPGIFSARYAGEDKNDEANIDKVLREMIDIPDDDRTAKFYCALAFSVPGKKTITVSGTCAGKILRERKGENGFGYDPIFYITDKGLTMAELSSSEKNQISHRANAINELHFILNDFFDLGEQK